MISNTSLSPKGLHRMFWFITIGSFLVILITLVLAYRFLRTAFKIRKWKQNLNLQTHYPIFEQLYSTVDGFKLSQEARSSLDAIDYTYGEIEFYPFIALLSMIRPHPNMIFYDLGSGVGKAVIACAMVYPMKKYVGIELIHSLHQSAQYQREQLLRHPSYQSHVAKVDFIGGDFLQTDLQDATCIFINSTTIFGETWEKLGILLDNLPSLETVITTSRPLSSKVFKPYQCPYLEMSWGIVQAFIHHSNQ